MFPTSQKLLNSIKTKKGKYGMFDLRGFRPKSYKALLKKNTP
jgi:hypothetical protein